MFESYQSTHRRFTVKAGCAKWGPVVALMFPTINRLLEKRVLNSTPESTGWERLGEVDLENRIRTHIDLHRLESLPEINKLHCNKDKYKMQSWDKRWIKCVVCEMRNN